MVSILTASRSLYLLTASLDGFVFGARLSVFGAMLYLIITPIVAPAIHISLMNLFPGPLLMVVLLIF
jgi:hypothetical protein